MTVEELIAKLFKMPAEMPVHVKMFELDTLGDLNEPVDHLEAAHGRIYICGQELPNA